MGGEFPVGFHWEYDGSRIIFDSQPSYLFFWGSRFGMNPFVSHLFAPSQGYFQQENFPNGGPVSFFRREGPTGSGAGRVLLQD